jgi:hypothetical protein
MLGLELEDARAIAVSVEDDGTVAARAVIGANGDLAAAAERALAQVASGSGALP